MMECFHVPIDEINGRFMAILRETADCPRCGATGDQPCLSSSPAKFQDGTTHPQRKTALQKAEEKIAVLRKMGLELLQAWLDHAKHRIKTYESEAHAWMCEGPEIMRHYEEMKKAWTE